MDRAHPYDDLQPAVVLDAAEQLGLETSGHLLALNSYENRVYRIGLEEGGAVVAKFYRPDRWTDDAIREEHDFAAELAEAELPFVPPIERDDETLFEWGGFRYAVFPSVGGHWPELGTEEDRRQVGRLMGRVHAIGARYEFEHRGALDVAAMGRASSEWLLDSGWIPAHLEAAYGTLSRDLGAQAETCIEAVSPRFVRIHGDCHPGNILWSDDGPSFVDLDDCISGPAVQDLWMLLSGDREEMTRQLADVLDGYRAFADFDSAELAMIEALRTLRMVHYAAWLARRWEDPAFPRAFPWFAENRYWEEHVLALREQAALMQEPPLCP